MSRITLYHNPRCSKSRAAKEILESHDVDFEVVDYLQEPLSEEEILALLRMLEMEPGDLVRKDSHFQELGLDAEAYTTVEAVAALLATHPRLMQRPVAVRDGRAVLGRPPERVEELIRES